jgi:WD40 repeat protein
MNAVAFSPDGSLLASASRDQTVRMWNASKGQELQEFENIPDISAINFSIDDNTILTNRGAVSVDKEPSAGMALESSTDQANMIMNDWIQRKSRNFLWLPHEYRSARLAFCDGMFAFGLHSGQVRFIQLDQC